MPQHLRHLLLALPVVLTLALAAPGSAQAAACPHADSDPAKVAPAKIRAATLCLINEIRAARGLKPLRAQARLALAGRRHARDMVRRRYFRHDTKGGGRFERRIRRTGYTKRARRWLLGENLGWGRAGGATPRSMVRAWMASPSHRRNILTPAFREIGIGTVSGAPVPGERAATVYATAFGALS